VPNQWPKELDHFWKMDQVVLLRSDVDLWKVFLEMSKMLTNEQSQQIYCLQADHRRENNLAYSKQFGYQWVNMIIFTYK
jgi:hypothetical protein